MCVWICVASDTLAVANLLNNRFAARWYLVTSPVATAHRLRTAYLVSRRLR